MADVTRFEIVSDQRFGEGGFLQLRRTWLRNVHTDGSRSKEYLCDFVERPRGLDAVSLVIWTRRGGSAKVLVRSCLRPPVQLARPGIHFIPVEESARPLLNPEIVAGLVEPGDAGIEGIRRRAAIEAHEETGHRVSAEDVVMLGAPSMPVPGLLPECEWYAAVEIRDPDAAGDRPGDGSPMEDGARLTWWDLGEAIRACVRGDIQDSKTEIGLRRLADRLQER